MNKEIPKLTASDIEVLVKKIDRYKKENVYANLLQYKNARVDMQILDYVFGVFGRQLRHKVIDGKLYCTVSIFDANNPIWGDKEDVGTKKQSHPYSKQLNLEKTEASDLFKRACVNVGIGRELYTTSKIFTTLNSTKFKEESQDLKRAK